MGIILLIILVLAVGAYIGFKAGKLKHIQDAYNLALSQMDILQQYNHHWFSLSKQKHELSATVANEQTKNVAQTMNLVISLMSVLQKEKANSLSTDEQEKINSIINQAHSILRSPNE